VGAAHGRRHPFGGPGHADLRQPRGGGLTPLTRSGGRRSPALTSTPTTVPAHHFTSPQIDYGAAIDIWRAMAACPGLHVGRIIGDEWATTPPTRRTIAATSCATSSGSACSTATRVLLLECRGFEVEQFRLANQIMTGLDIRDWQRTPTPLAVVVAHPWEDDKYYRTPPGWPTTR